MKTLILTFAIACPLFLTAKFWTPVDAEFDSIANDIYEAFIGIPDPAEVYGDIQKLKALAEEHPETKAMQWRAKYWDSRMARRRDYEYASQKIASHAMELVDSAAYPYDWHMIDWLITANQARSGINMGLYQHLLDEIKYFETIGDSLQVANTYVLLGNMLKDIYLPDNGLHFQEKAEAIYRELGMDLFASKVALNKSNMLRAMGKYDESLSMLKSIIEDKTLVRDTLFYVSALNSLSTFEKEDISKWAIREAYRLSSLTDHTHAYYRSLINMGAYYLGRQQNDSAKIYYAEAIPYFVGNNMYQELIPCLNGLSYSYWGLNQLDSALLYLNTSVHFRDSIHLNNQGETIQRLETKALIEQHAEHLAFLEHKSRMERVVWAVAIVVLLILSCVVAYILRAKQSRAKALKDLYAAKLENEELRSTILQQKTEENQRELMTKELLLAKDQQLMGKIRDQIVKGGKTGEISKQTEIVLKSEISSNMNTENRWENFFIHFNQIHPKFFVNLLDSYPTLTINERRLCAYIRTGLSNKQIAELLAIQPDAVKVARYRMRKKLGLRTPDSLEDFLMQFSITGS